MHELGEFVCAKGNVWASKTQVLEASNERSILGWDGKRSPESLSNLFVADNGVDAGFVSIMPDLCSRSVIYFRWERNIPAVEGIISTPKK